MATIIADNIITPLGFTTEENLRAVRSGKTALRHYPTSDKVPFPFTASLFSDEQLLKLTAEGFTRFESLALASIKSALATCTLQGRALLIISSTKGNVESLSISGNEEAETDLGKAALKISKELGLTEIPIVVSNACISGVSALILAERLLQTHKADTVIVCGADVQNTFIISGFESLKALSESECRPFDIERLGLNLGEAAATIVLSNRQPEERDWQLLNGIVRNDAFHISSPSPKGDGAYLALSSAMGDIPVEDIAVVNAHGTGTMYNDQMESISISRAGLSNVPTNALKGFFGHTMGAAGVLETILTYHALDEKTILATRNFENLGVSGKVNISSEEQVSEKNKFIKMISGFGGGNAVLIGSKGVSVDKQAGPLGFGITHHVELTPYSLIIDGEKIEATECEDKLLTSLYKEKIGDYPKFYKMDSLSRLGFLAAEILLQSENDNCWENTASRGIAFFNQKSSLKSDLKYLETIRDNENFFPSPSLFVYTLPNIVTGEIAIHHHILGETAFYVLPGKNWEMIKNVVECMFCDVQTESIIAGWVEYVDSNNFEANIFIANKTK